MRERETLTLAACTSLLAWDGNRCGSWSHREAGEAVARAC